MMVYGIECKYKPISVAHTDCIVSKNRSPYWAFKLCSAVKVRHDGSFYEEKESQTLYVYVYVINILIK